MKMRYSPPDSGLAFSGWPTYTGPASDPGGRSGVSIVAVPTCEPAGQATGPVVPLPNWVLVHACRPAAAAGLSVMPSGSATLTFRGIELSMLSALEFWGTSTLTVAPSGSSDWVVAGVTFTVGANGTFSQPLAPTGVVNVFSSRWPS